MVNREFAEWYCHTFDKMCSITNDEVFWKSRDLNQLIATRDSLLYDSSRIDNILKGLKDNDEELALRCMNFIVRTVRFLNVPVENWKYGLRKYREKRCIYNYIYTDNSIMIIGQQPSGSVEVNIYDSDSCYDVVHVERTLLGWKQFDTYLNWPKWSIYEENKVNLSCNMRGGILVLLCYADFGSKRMFAEF